MWETRDGMVCLTLVTASSSIHSVYSLKNVNCSISNVLSLFPNGNEYIIYKASKKICLHMYIRDAFINFITFATMKIYMYVDVTSCPKYFEKLPSCIIVFLNSSFAHMGSELTSIKNDLHDICKNNIIRCVVIPVYLKSFGRMQFVVNDGLGKKW